MNLKTRVLVVTVGAVSALALTSGTAMASGGNTGGGGGGGGRTVTTPPAASCLINTFSNTTGYYSVYAAIWTPFSISTSCGYAVNWQMTYTNNNTGQVDFSRSSSTAYMSAGTIDEDWAALSTPYTITLTVTDSSGVVIDTRSAAVTTKKPKSVGA